MRLEQKNIQKGKRQNGGEGTCWIKFRPLLHQVLSLLCRPALYFGIKGLGPGADNLASHGVPGRENVTDHRRTETTATSVSSIICSQRWTFIYILQSSAARTIKLPHSCYYFFPCFCPQKRQQSCLAAIRSPGTQT